MGKKLLKKEKKLNRMYYFQTNQTELRKLASADINLDYLKALYTNLEDNQSQGMTFTSGLKDFFKTSKGDLYKLISNGEKFSNGYWNLYVKCNKEYLPLAKYNTVGMKTSITNNDISKFTLKYFTRQSFVVLKLKGNDIDHSKYFEAAQIISEHNRRVSNAIADWESNQWLPSNYGTFKLDTTGSHRSSHDDFNIAPKSFWMNSEAIGKFSDSFKEASQQVKREAEPMFALSKLALGEYKDGYGINATDGFLYPTCPAQSCSLSKSTSVTDQIDNRIKTNVSLTVNALKNAMGSNLVSWGNVIKMTLKIKDDYSYYILPLKDSLEDIETEQQVIVVGTLKASFKPAEKLKEVVLVTRKRIKLRRGAKSYKRSSYKKSSYAKSSRFYKPKYSSRYSSKSYSKRSYLSKYPKKRYINPKYSYNLKK